MIQIVKWIEKNSLTICYFVTIQPIIDFNILVECCGNDVRAQIKNLANIRININ